MDRHVLNSRSRAVVGYGIIIFHDVISEHLVEMKCDMQISYEMVSNAHVHQLTVSP